MKYKIFLGSKSIRRRNILKSMDIDFNVLHSNIKQDYPDNLKGKNVSEFLARIKSEDLISNISSSNAEEDDITGSGDVDDSDEFFKLLLVLLLLLPCPDELRLSPE